MAPFSVVIKSNRKDTSSQSHSSRLLSRVGSKGSSYDLGSLDLGGDVVLSGEPPGNIDESIVGVATGESLVKINVGSSNKSNGSVAKAKGSRKGSIVKSDSFSIDRLSGINDHYQQQYQQGNKEVVAGPTIQDPSLHFDYQQQYQQQYQHGYLVSGFSQGMTPTQHRTVPPDMLPPDMIMMPSYYNNCAPYYDYSCGYHRNMVTNDDWSSCRMDDTYSSHSSGSSCATLLCAEPSEFSKLVLRAVDSLCGGTSNNVGSDKCSSTHATKSPEDHDELLEKVDKLYKSVTEMYASGEAIKETMDMNPLAAVNESDITQHAGNEFIGFDLFPQEGVKDDARHSSSTHATLSTPQNHAELLEKVDNLCKLVAERRAYGEAEMKSTNMIPVEASTCFNLFTEDQLIETIEDDAKDSKISKDNKIETEADNSLKTIIGRSCISLESCQAKEEKVSVQKEPGVDSMGFPLENTLRDSSSEHDLDSSIFSALFHSEDQSIEESSFPVNLSSLDESIEAEADFKLSMVERTDHRDDILVSVKDPHVKRSKSHIKESLKNKIITRDENESVDFPDDEKMHHQDGNSNHSTISSSSCICIAHRSEGVDTNLWDHDDRQRDLYCAERGGVENLIVRQYSSLPAPNAPDHVLVKVEATTVSSNDCIVKDSFRFIPGFQVVGQVCALGTMVDSLKTSLGDRVAALLPKGGGNAKYISIPVSWAILLPKSASHDDIICLVANYMTAYQCLKLAKKDGAPLTNANVLITGGSGPVGQALVELAFQDGANVYATAHEMHKEYLTKLGVQWLCLKPQQWPPELEGKMDVVIDLLKIDGYKSSYHALRRDGILICNFDKVSEIRNDMSWWDTVKAKSFWNPPIMYELFGSFTKNPAMFAQELSYLTWKLQRGEIRPKVAGRVSLNQVPTAMQLIEKGLMNGTVVCQPWKILDPNQKVKVEEV